MNISLTAYVDWKSCGSWLDVFIYRIWCLVASNPCVVQLSHNCHSCASKAVEVMASEIWKAEGLVAINKRRPNGAV